MRHAFVIARRELGEKRFVALAAAAFAVLPFLLAAIPVIRGRNGSGEVIAVGAGLLAIGFTGGLALILGGTIVGRDLSEGRLSFYFARPVGAASIWFGKVAGAVALIAGVFAIIVLPARIAAAGAWQHSWGRNALLLALAVIGSAVALFFVAHVIGSFVRSRSAWIGVDFVALSLAGLAVFLILRPLLDAGAFDATKTLAIAIGSGVAMALIGCGAWQLERGRTDRRRSHTALSQFLWAVIGATLILAGAFVAWMLAAKPSDLKSVEAETQSHGPWVMVTGYARGRMDYHPAFVYNAETGAYSRFPTRAGREMFTRDGASIVSGRYDKRTNTLEMLRRPVAADAEEPTGLTLAGIADFNADDDGSRIVSTDNKGIVTVYDVPQKKSLVSARLPESSGRVFGMYFLSPELVRLHTINREGGQVTLHIFDLDVTKRSLQPAGEFARQAKYFGVTANADGSRLLVRDRPNLYVLDGHTAALQQTIPAAELRGSTFLRDGGVAILTDAGGHSTIEVRDAAGTPVRTLTIPLAHTWSLRELPDGRFITLGQTQRWETYIVDSTSGKIVQHIPAQPVSAQSVGWSGYDPRREPAELPKLFSDGKRLIRWNYTTNQAEVLLPR
jgi:ABC-type transport system involved in multi-copper enzyme maturation permease subunit